MSDWMNVKLVRQHQRERLQESRHDRLIQDAKGTVPSRPIYAPTLAMFGGWLVTWGNQLQLHYGNIVDNMSTIGNEDCGDSFVTQPH
jgi:hypothetical protein